MRGTRVRCIEASHEAVCETNWGGCQGPGSDFWAGQSFHSDCQDQKHLGSGGLDLDPEARIELLEADLSSSTEADVALPRQGDLSFTVLSRRFRVEKAVNGL